MKDESILIASHAARGPQNQGRGPVDPKGTQRVQSAFIKFRVTVDEKRSIERAAAAADLTVSAVLRRAGRAVVAGRIPSRNVVADLVAMRYAANELAVLAENPNSNLNAVADAVRATAKEIHLIASRHLSNVR